MRKTKNRNICCFARNTFVSTGIEVLGELPLKDISSREPTEAACVNETCLSHQKGTSPAMKRIQATPKVLMFLIHLFLWIFLDDCPLHGF